MAEIHIIGQITHAEQFPLSNLFCKWSVQHGNNWKVIAGKQEGQTPVVTSLYEANVCKWSYPIDIHLTTNGIPGWPKIYVQIYHLDWLGRCHLLGYGFVIIPTTSGVHQLSCHTWRPFGSIRERFTQYFLGGGPQLKSPDAIFHASERYKLNTETMGVVRFSLNVILRNFHKFGVEYN